MSEKIYWITKDGRKLNVDDMSEQHVKNILKMLIRQSTENVNKRLFNQEEADLRNPDWGNHVED